MDVWESDKSDSSRESGGVLLPGLPLWRLENGRKLVIISSPDPRSGIAGVYGTLLTYHVYPLYLPALLLNTNWLFFPCGFRIFFPFALLIVSTPSQFYLRMTCNILHPACSTLPASSLALILELLNVHLDSSEREKRKGLTLV